VHCQLDYLSRCLPGRIRDALDELPETLDGTYERTLREINDANWEFARRLLLCVAVVSHPLRVEELAEFLAFDFSAGQIPKYREDWRLGDSEEAVLSTCSTLLSLVTLGNSQVIQFSHFSVKEFLTSSRFSEKRDTISRRYHISMTPAHTLVAQVCLGALLHLDVNVTRDKLAKFPLARYAAEHWLEHARFVGVSKNVDEGTKRLFDKTKPHFVIWLWICDPTVYSWNRHELSARPLPPRGTPLHYAAFCGLHEVVKALVIEHRDDVNSHTFDNESTPLHLASRWGHTEVARILVEHGADMAAQEKDGWTPLHLASQYVHVDLARILLEHGADPAAQNKDGWWWTPLHFASENGHLDLARILLEHGADLAAQNKGGWTPLHFASANGHLDLARILIEHGGDTTAQEKDGWTPLHFASENGHLDLARILLEHGADPAAQKKDGWTPLHFASVNGHMDLARILVEHGANVAIHADDGLTPLHCASNRVHVGLVRFLVEHGANVTAQDKQGCTPLHWVSLRGNVDFHRSFPIIFATVRAAASVFSSDSEPSESAYVDLAKYLVEHGADMAAQDEHGSIPSDLASRNGHAELARFLHHGAVTTAHAMLQIDQPTT
jgi:ankyrin repeat protein